MNLGKVNIKSPEFAIIIYGVWESFESRKLVVAKWLNLKLQTPVIFILRARFKFYLWFSYH